MINKRSLTIILVVSTAIVVLIIVAIFLSNNIQRNSVLKTEVVVSPGAGIPLESSPTFTEQGWNKIPNIDSLMELAAEQDGGEITSIKMVTNSSQIYVRVQNTSDNGSFSYYFHLNNNVWEIAEPSTVPTLAKSILDS